MLRPTVQSASLSWNKAPIWGLRPHFYYWQTFAGLLMWGSLSDERTGLSFTIAAGPLQRSYSRVSDSILPFSSPPLTRRATVEVSDPASARESNPSQNQSYFTSGGLPPISPS
jgi:hypothetical protein